jgi:hydroxyacid-oxoacid transhydrogenase
MLDMPIDPVFKFRTVPMRYGVGILREIGYDLTNLGIKNCMIITDKHMTEDTKIIEQTKASIEEQGLEVNIWNETEAEPSASSIQKGIEYASTMEFNGIIAIGGGSAIDTAKAINLYTSYPADFYDYFSPPIGKGVKIPGTLKPLVAVPTTSGTGSETTGVSIVSFPDRKLKYGLSNEYLVPRLAIIDPLTTITMPPSVTANTGMDALMHAIEAFTSIPFYAKPKPKTPLERSIYQGANPISDALSIASIESIGKYLLPAYANGNDIEARSKMHLASHIAGLAFGNAGVHIPHALSYPLAGECLERGIKLPHGLAVTITGPATLRVIAPYLQERCITIASLLGENANGIPLLEMSFKAAEVLVKLMKALDLPSGISELGIVKSDLADLAEKALLQKRVLAQSPIFVNKKLLERILKESLQYW